MSATLHRLPPVSEMGHFLRLGHTGEEGRSIKRRNNSKGRVKT